MKKLIGRLVVFFFLAAFLGCNKVQTKQIIVYGSSDCHHCTDFLAELDSADMEYKFKDFMVSEDIYMKELMGILRQHNYTDYVNFPVAVVEDQLFVEAKFEEVKKAVYE